MKLAIFALLLGVTLGVIFAPIAPKSADPKPLFTAPEARVEVSIGGFVHGYSVPIDHVIHVIADDDDRLTDIQLIPDVLNVNAKTTLPIHNGQSINPAVSSSGS